MLHNYIDMPYEYCIINCAYLDCARFLWFANKEDVNEKE